MFRTRWNPSHTLPLCMAAFVALGPDHPAIAEQAPLTGIVKCLPFSLTAPPPADTFIDLGAADTHAYVLTRDLSLTIFDISDPARPLQVGLVPPATDLPVQIESHLALAGTTACVIHENGSTAGQGDWGLMVFDVSNPAAPVRAADFRMYDHPCDLVARGTTVWVLGDNWDGTVYQFDISNPADPQLVLGFPVPYYVQAITALGDLIFVAVVDHNDRWGPTYPTSEPTTGQLLVFDVNSLSTTPVGRCPLTGLPRHLASQGSFVYVSGDPGGLQIVDVSDPSAPVRVGTYAKNMSTLGVDVSGNQLLVYEGYRAATVLDISTPAQPIELTSFREDLVPLHFVDSSNSLLAVDCERSALAILRVDDRDADGATDTYDNCPGLFNPDQQDRDGDGVGDACDQCPDNPNKAQKDYCGCSDGPCPVSLVVPLSCGLIALPLLGLTVLGLAALRFGPRDRQRPR